MSLIAVDPEASLGLSLCTPQLCFESFSLSLSVSLLVLVFLLSPLLSGHWHIVTFFIIIRYIVSTDEISNECVQKWSTLVICARQVKLLN